MNPPTEDGTRLRIRLAGPGMRGAASRSSTRWLETRPFTVLVAAGDVAVIVLLLAAGLFAHGTDPLAAPGYTLRTASPFVLGWVIAAPLFGAYGRHLRSRPTVVAGAVVGAWIGAVLLGAAIRSTGLVPGTAPPVFVAVTVAVGLPVLLPWRVAVSLVGDGG